MSGFINQERINNLKDNQPFGFGDAIFMLRAGFRLRRKNWKNVLYVELQKPDENSKMKQAYIYCVPQDRQPVPWTASQADILMSDWMVDDSK